MATVLSAPANRAARDGPGRPVPMMMASKCFMQLVRLLSGACPLRPPLPAFCRSDARRYRRRTIPTSGASEPSVHTCHDVLLSLARAPCHRGNVKIADPSPRQPGCDLLQQPAVAIRIMEGGKRVVTRMCRVRTIDAETSK